MKAGEKDGSSLNHLTRFLLRYRSIPHNTSNVAPSDLFLGCNLHTLFDLLKPGIETRVLSKNKPIKRDTMTKELNLIIFLQISQ